MSVVVANECARSLNDGANREWISLGMCASVCTCIICTVDPVGSVFFPFSAAFETLRYVHLAFHCNCLCFRESRWHRFIVVFVFVFCVIFLCGCHVVLVSTASSSVFTDILALVVLLAEG